MIINLKRKTYSAAKLFSNEVKNKLNKAINTTNDRINYLLDEADTIKNNKNLIKYLNNEENLITELKKYNDFGKKSAFGQTRAVAKAADKWAEILSKRNKKK